MTLSEKSFFGFLATVAQLLQNERAALEKAGWDVDAIIASVQKMHDAAVSANESQEAAKRHLKATTDAFVAQRQQAYMATSGYLDMAIAAVGKGTAAAKNLRRYRGQARRQSGDVVVPAPVAPPQTK